MEYIPKLGEVVEGFDDTDETNLDLEDEPMPLAVEVLFYLIFSSKGDGV